MGKAAKVSESRSGRKALFTAGELAGAIGGKVLSGDPNVLIHGVTIDSRDVKAGDVFFALPGTRFDGHQFVGAAFERGASAAVVSRSVHLDLGASQALINCADTVTALGDAASYYAFQFKMPVVCVTGSVGKTSTKELIATVLSRRFSVLKSEGNYNTEIGVPLTIFQVGPNHSAVVLEMAMRGLGQISRLAQIAHPTVGVVTNVGPSHLELLGTVENVAKAKGELVEALREDGVAVLNGDDELVKQMSSRCKGQVIFYGFGEHCHVRACSIVQIKEKGSIEFELKLNGKRKEIQLNFPGRQFVYNALAAIAVGHVLGVPLNEIAEAVSGAVPASMRFEAREIAGIKLINDAYNANPLSVNAALEALVNIGGNRKLAVLGPMLELGPRSVEFHQQVGEAAARLGVDVLITLGELAGEIAVGALRENPSLMVMKFLDPDEAVKTLTAFLSPGDCVLFKASRAAKFEVLLQKVEQQLQEMPEVGESERKQGKMRQAKGNKME